MYLVPVSAVDGASLGPVVERRFLALHTTLKHDPVVVLITVKFTRYGRGQSVLESGKYLLMVPAVRPKTWSRGELFLHAAVDARRKMQLNVEPLDLTCE